MTEGKDGSVDGSTPSRANETRRGGLGKPMTKPRSTEPRYNEHAIKRVRGLLAQLPLSPRDKAELLLELVGEMAVEGADISIQVNGSRVCAQCGASLRGRRADAEYCGATCRQRASRARRAA